jgi:1,4-alpha-glucan branching enzyme
LKKQICQCEGGIDKFTSAYKSFGIHIGEDNSVSCKEWAPGARQLYLYGDFSKICSSKNFLLQLTNIFNNFNAADGWEKKRNPYEKLDFGKWQLHLPANPDGTCPIKHGSKIKVVLHLLMIFFKLWSN